MTAFRQSKIASILILCLILSFPSSTPADQLTAEQELRIWTPYIERDKQRLYIDTLYEYSPVRIAGRKTHWEQYSTRVMGTYQGHLPYFEYHLFERDREWDQALHLGSYFLFENWNLQPEIGFGIDTDFLYRFQTSAAVERRLVESLYFKIKERYLHYRAGDVLITSPGLSYYYGDHFLTADYNVSLTEGRGNAHYATVQTHLLFFKRLHLYSGIALGERLFDVDALDASKQMGFILSAGADFRVSKNVKVGFDYSFGEEENPKFRKRGFGGRISVRF